jgi:hypothetical protein
MSSCSTARGSAPTFPPTGLADFRFSVRFLDGLLSLQNRNLTSLLYTTDTLNRLNGIYQPALRVKPQLHAYFLACTVSVSVGIDTDESKTGWLSMHRLPLVSVIARASGSERLAYCMRSGASMRCCMSARSRRGCMRAVKLLSVKSCQLTAALSVAAHSACCRMHSTVATGGAAPLSIRWWWSPRV